MCEKKHGFWEALDPRIHFPKIGGYGNEQLASLLQCFFWIRCLSCIIQAKESGAIQAEIFWRSLWTMNLRNSLGSFEKSHSKKTACAFPLCFFFHKFCFLLCPALLPLVYLSSLSILGGVVGVVGDSCDSVFIEADSTLLVKSVGQRACFVLMYQLKWAKFSS